MKENNKILFLFRIRSPSPEILNEVNISNNILDSNGEVRDVYYLPPPLPCEEAMPRNRIPSPIIREKEELNLDYVKCLC